MRIALVTHKVDFNDGQGRVNYELVMAALERGHQVTVVANSCSENIARHPNGRFVNMGTPNLPTQLLRNYYFAYKSSWWLKKNRQNFDIVQANGYVTWEPADVVAVHFVHRAWLHNLFYPFHWSSLRPYAYYQRIFTILNCAYERGAFERAAVLVAVSESTANELAELGYSHDKIKVVYNGVDANEFQPGSPNREAFDLPLNVPLALFVGDIKTSRKNLETVLYAMQRVPTLHLAVAGSTSGSPYPALAKSIGISDRVHFLGKTSRISKLMQSVDFFVFPSRYEAHPLVLIEAMASGLPVVVSANFGAEHYVGNAGKIIDNPNDYRALADAMIDLLGDREVMKRMGASARKRAMEMTWANTADGYLKVYESIIERKS